MHRDGWDDVGIVPYRGDQRCAAGGRGDTPPLRGNFIRFKPYGHSEGALAPVGIPLLRAGGVVSLPYEGISFGLQHTVIPRVR